MSIQGLGLVTLIRIVIFKFELKEALDLPDNTVCYIDDISIPHTWRTIESHNNKFYTIFKMMYLAGGGYEMTEEYNYNPYVLELPRKLHRTTDGCCHTSTIKRVYPFI